MWLARLYDDSWEVQTYEVDPKEYVYAVDRDGRERGRTVLRKPRSWVFGPGTRPPTKLDDGTEYLGPVICKAGRAAIGRTREEAMAGL